MTGFCNLLGQSREANSEVSRRWEPAARASRSVGWDEFRHDVASLQARLAQGQVGAWVLLTEDAYAFAVGLFALWHSGCHAILPPNRQPRSLALLQTRAVGVLSDRPEWFSGGLPVHPLQGGERVAGFPMAPLNPDALSVELFTSGTTGDEKPVVKRIVHLEEEVLQLEACWGGLVSDSTFFSTASHQHLYGLLFGVLWPLCGGRPFEARHYLHAGELVPRMLDTDACVLAGIPTSLKYLARHAGSHTLRKRCRVVFSSGGPLPTETALAVADVLGDAPIEVLGSTETGGIAWRAQEPGTPEVLWTPLPRVQISRDEDTGGLRVRSPLVSIGDSGEGFATGDRIELYSDGCFRLEGRSDQIVKVGEKRLDLTRMASQLRGHEWVEEAALTTIERESGLRVAAVVVASEHGLDVLHREGRRAFFRGLREILSESWDPVLHPRHWRVVVELPENAQGKVTREAIGRLFQAGEMEAE